MSAPKMLTKEELKLEPEFYPQVNKWLVRGDGIAVYENKAFDSSECGHRQFFSFGSEDAQFKNAETEDLPQRLPDFPGKTNWAYQLVGTYRGEVL